MGLGISGVKRAPGSLSLPKTSVQFSKGSLVVTIRLCRS